MGLVKLYLDGLPTYTTLSDLLFVSSNTKSSNLGVVILLHMVSVLILELAL